ncbi:glycoside hydrolase family 43 protein [Kineococcus sp. SYSU DK006]|uniref:glycoside hydrolase family 43 protein n=1 Tax=Kineococcus sp. SYSU DK006 TaxID=3383127 RepID=UPI003D7C3B16
MPDEHGYLLVHHVEAPDGHGEQVHFSLSDGDDARRWTRRNRGEPVLTWSGGTTGIRDPHVVAGAGEFFVVATDLRIYGGDGRGWDEWTRTGSRDVVVWRSEDLVHWSQPWALEIAPPTAGMAWAPEAVFDQASGEFVVHWSSTLYDPQDTGHRGASYSRVLAARTRDFRSVGPAEVVIDRGFAVIDTTTFRDGDLAVRVSKDDSRRPDALKLFQETDTGSGWELVATRIADELYADVEAPVVFRDRRRGVWYLLVDQYEVRPQGYTALVSDDPASGRWTPLPAGEFSIPPNTKHGGVLPLVGDQWQRLAEAFPA